MNSTWQSQYTRKYNYYSDVQTCVPRNNNYEKWPAGESPAIVWSPKYLSVWVLLHMIFGKGHSSPGDFPVLCRQDIRAALKHPGPSGETGHVPFPSVPASWTRGNNCLHKNSLLARIACLPCPSRTGEPAQAFSCLETRLQLHDQQLWQHYSHSNHPPTYTGADWFIDYNKRQKNWFMKILSEPSGGHFTVTPLLLFKSPRSPRRKCFLQSRAGKF